jgi:hypothetical protein
MAASILVAIFLLYLGLVPLGQWQSDEFDYFGKLRLGVGTAVLNRLWWSPRPASEFVYGIYGLLANHFQRPLTGFFLACLWLGLLVCACATSLWRSSATRRPLLPDLLIGLGFAAAFLTSGPLFQVFYWPAGAVAYLPTLSATLLLFLQVMSGALFTPRGRLLCSGCLVIAALSTEIGAILAVCFGPLQAADALFSRQSEQTSHPRIILWWLMPAMLGVAVLWWAAVHRVPVPGSGLSLGLGNDGGPLARLLAAGRELLVELLGFSPTAKHPLSAIPTQLSRLLIAVGVALLSLHCNGAANPEKPRPQRQTILLAAAFLAACFCTLFATYPQFALAGGERYETVRRCWILMAFAALAVVGFQTERGRGMLVRSQQSNLAPVLLIIGVLLPWHVSPLLREYRVYSAVLRATAENFRPGYQHDSQQMMFIVPPNRGVITPQRLVPGTYTRTWPATENDYARNMLGYFGKEVLVVKDGNERREAAR